MKFLLPIAALSLLFSLSVLADPEAGPLQVQTPDGWSEKYPSDDGAKVYTLTKTEGGNSLLIFSRWTAPGTRTEIPSFLGSMARKFAAMAKDNPKIKLTSDSYTKGDFIGDPFSGKFVLFAMDRGLVQTFFMFNDGDEIWSGQYSGTADGWSQAVDILKVIKKNG